MGGKGWVGGRRESICLSVQSSLRAPVRPGVEEDSVSPSDETPARCMNRRRNDCLRVYAFIIKIGEGIRPLERPSELRYFDYVNLGIMHF